MSLLQKTLAAIFPKRKTALILNEQKELFYSVINSLPDDFADLKIQAKANNFEGLKNWELHPDFKYTEITYPGENYRKYHTRGKDIKISGLRIFSKVHQRFEEAEIVLHNNLIWAFKISHSKYKPEEFDFSNIKNKNIDIATFKFEPIKVDIFYDNLDDAIKEKLDYYTVFDIDYDGRIFYTFYDFEDGNYLAVDKELNVYSLVYDAEKEILKMETSFLDILEEINTNRFDQELHLENRYK